MKISKVLAVTGLILFAALFIIPGQFDGQLFPYQSGIALTLFLLAIVVEIIIRIKQTHMIGGKANPKPTIGMWILACGIIFGIYCWLTSGDNQGLQGMIVIYAYAAILVGGLMVILKK